MIKVFTRHGWKGFGRGLNVRPLHWCRLIGRNALYMVLAACLPAWGAKPCALACVGLDVGLWKVLQLAGKLSANNVISETKTICKRLFLIGRHTCTKKKVCDSSNFHRHGSPNGRNKAYSPIWNGVKFV